MRSVTGLRELKRNDQKEASEVLKTDGLKVLAKIIARLERRNSLHESAREKSRDYVLAHS